MGHGNDAASAPQTASSGKLRRRSMVRSALKRVMLVDVDNMDKWRDHDRDVVREVVRVDVTLVSCPPHVAPGMTAAMNVYRGAGRNDGLHPWLIEGPALRLRFALVWVTAASDEAE